MFQIGMHRELINFSKIKINSIEEDNNIKTEAFLCLMIEIKIIYFLY